MHASRSANHILLTCKGGASRSALASGAHREIPYARWAAKSITKGLGNRPRGDISLVRLLTGREALWKELKRDAGAEGRLHHAQLRWPLPAFVSPRLEPAWVHRYAVVG